MWPIAWLVGYSVFGFRRNHVASRVRAPMGRFANPGVSTMRDCCDLYLIGQSGDAAQGRSVDLPASGDWIAVLRARGATEGTSQVIVTLDSKSQFPPGGPTDKSSKVEAKILFGVGGSDPHEVIVDASRGTHVTFPACSCDISARVVGDFSANVFTSRFSASLSWGGTSNATPCVGFTRDLAALETWDFKIPDFAQRILIWAAPNPMLLLSQLRLSAGPDPVNDVTLLHLFSLIPAANDYRTDGIRIPPGARYGRYSNAAIAGRVTLGFELAI